MKCKACGSDKVFLAGTVNGVEVEWFCWPCTWTVRPELILKA